MQPEMTDIRPERLERPEMTPEAPEIAPQNAPREAVQESLDIIIDIQGKVGFWKTSTTVRRDGVDVHYKFPFPVRTEDAQRFAKIAEQAPTMLAEALRLFLQEPS